MSYTQGGRVYLVASRGSLDNPSMRTHRVAQTLVGGHKLDIVRDQDLPLTWAPLSSWPQAAPPCAPVPREILRLTPAPEQAPLAEAPSRQEQSLSCRCYRAAYCMRTSSPALPSTKRAAARQAVGRDANGIDSVASTHCHVRMRGDELRLRAHPSKFPIVSAPATHVARAGSASTSRSATAAASGVPADEAAPVPADAQQFGQVPSRFRFDIQAGAVRLVADALPSDVQVTRDEGFVVRAKMCDYCYRNNKVCMWGTGYDWRGKKRVRSCDLCALHSEKCTLNPHKRNTEASRRHDGDRADLMFIRRAVDNIPDFALRDPVIERVNSLAHRHDVNLGTVAPPALRYQLSPQDPVRLAEEMGLEDENVEDVEDENIEDDDSEDERRRE
ncbi:uncharacterized protein SRS1_25012 [Sporisorium reilianum f. sp. reilianum]|uniref:Uncharacterized protein n=1 Tax=Sporisorium reilianum f. sp. reilianum TaxID=72559 RepID=A0A2N8UJC3_9BASI|nr:uncharacterized protein SRS1_25012 [Sporisorium reilianum f. sp. reilianum]